MFSKFKNRMLAGLFVFLLTACFVAPSFGTMIERGDKVFAGKITFEQDVTAKKNFTIEGSLAGDDTANKFYVSSATGSDVPHYGETWQKPFASISYALDQCTANNGDAIYVLSGHTKTITADSGVDIDVAGVSVIGLGQGSDRPTFTFTTATTADFKMAAANTRLYNMLFVTNFDEHDMAIEVSADDVEIGWCEFREGTHQPEFGIQVGAGSADNDADRCWIHDCKFYVPTAGDGDAAISIAKDMTGVKIERNVIYGDFDLAGISVPTGGNAQVDLLISDCVVTNLLTSQHAIEIIDANSTGKIVNCYLETDAIGTSIDAGGLEPYNVLWSDGTDQVMAALALAPVGGASTFTTDELAAIEGEATDAIEADDLDHLMMLDGATQVYPENCATDSVLAKVLVKADPAVPSQYDNSTDSLEAISDALAAGTGCTAAIDADGLDHIVTTADGTGAYPASVVDDSILALLMSDDDPASASSFNNTTDSLEAIRVQLDTVPGSGNSSTFNSTALTAIEGEATDAIEADELDHLAAASDGTDEYPASVVEDSVLAKILGDDDPAVATTYDNTTDSLEAIGTKTTDQAYWQERTVSVSADEVTADLFDVDGGPILIKSMVGYVDAVIGANATSAQLIIDRDDEATDTEFTTSVAITDDVVGTTYIFTSANAAVLTPLTPGAVGSSNLMSPWFCPEGMIEQLMTADPGGAEGDHITWYMTYVPLTTGVTVTAQ